MERVCSLTGRAVADPWRLRPNVPGATAFVQQAGFERQALEDFLRKYGSHPCDSLLLVTMADFYHDVQVLDDQKAAEESGRHQVKISANTRVEGDGNVVHVQLELSAQQPARPLDICFVIDKSGSMNGAVTPKSASPTWYGAPRPPAWTRSGPATARVWCSSTTAAPCTFGKPWT